MRLHVIDFDYVRKISEDHLRADNKEFGTFIAIRVGQREMSPSVEKNLAKFLLSPKSQTPSGEECLEILLTKIRIIQPKF